MEREGVDFAAIRGMLGAMSGAIRDACEVEIR
jgi:hypothetical protein